MFTILGIVVAAVLMGHALLKANSMGPATPHLRRASYVVLATGAFGLLLRLLLGKLGIELECGAIAAGTALCIASQHFHRWPSARP